MSGRVRLGVIGAGAWAATNHIPVLAARDEVELVAACRPGTNELAALQRRFGFAYVTEDYRELLEHRLDAVVVASPPSFHYEHVAAALATGAHVLCEKPFTVEPQHAWALAEQASRSGRHLIVAFGWNWIRAVQRARELLAEHPIGDVRHVLVHMASDVWELLHGTGTYQEADPDFPPDLATWSDPARSGGGYAPGQLSHALALLFWLTDVRCLEVRAAFDPGTTIDIFDALALRLNNGGVGVASGASTTTGGAPREQIEVRLFGTEGHFVLDLEREQLEVYTPASGAVRVALGSGDGLYECSGPPNALVDLAMGHDVDNRSPATLAADVVETVYAASRSAESGAAEPCGPGARL